LTNFTKKILEDYIEEELNIEKCRMYVARIKKAKQRISKGKIRAIVMSQKIKDILLKNLPIAYSNFEERYRC
jgi:anthranilate/para-aminobenzoate synthase component I